MYNLNISILDAGTLGDDIDFSMFDVFGNVNIYEKTKPEEVGDRISGSDVVIVNKIKLNGANLGNAKKLRLICVTATGFDNIDTAYCKENKIAVCNVKGYSTDSVAQITMAMALSLINSLPQYDSYVKDLSYTKSGVQNCVTPVFREMSRLTWGVVGLGGIGRRVAELAKAFGCRILAYKRSADSEFNCVSLEELCTQSDIISIHLPLSEQTHQIISKSLIEMMKKTAVVINAARGAVVDEAALAKAIKEDKLGGLGVDVYSTEPMTYNSPYTEITDRKNVILTPHMAWAAYESRVRCMEEIVNNIRFFMDGEIRNRVDI